MLTGEFHLLGQGLAGEEVSDGIVGFDVGSRIGACGLSYRILVDKLHVADGIDVAIQSEIFPRDVAHLA